MIIEELKKIPSPCYVLEERLLRNNLEILQNVIQKADVEILLALKGFAFWKVFPIVKQYLSGAAASSLNEVRLIYEEMGTEAHTYCPVFLENDFDEILQKSSHLIFNSFNQWEKYKNKILNSNKNVKCGLRINPEYSEVKTELYNPALPESRLGIPAYLFSEKLPEGISGLHFHALCENDSYVLERTLKAVEAKFSHLISQCKWFNMGGGHLITREGYDIEHLISLLKDFKQRYPNLEKIYLEPGGAIGWQTGFLLSTVQDIIQLKDINIAMLDVSFTCHMPDCLEMPYKPHVWGSTFEKTPYRYRLGGISCLSGDYMGMGDYYFNKPLKEGDLIIFDDMIHYTMVKTTNFNGINLPNIGIIDLNENFHLIKTFGYQTYKERLS